VAEVLIPDTEVGFGNPNGDDRGDCVRMESIGDMTSAFHPFDPIGVRIAGGSKQIRVDDGIGGTAGEDVLCPAADCLQEEQERGVGESARNVANVIPGVAEGAIAKADHDEKVERVRHFGDDGVNGDDGETSATEKRGIGVVEQENWSSGSTGSAGIGRVVHDDKSGVGKRRQEKGELETVWRYEERREIASKEDSLVIWRFVFAQNEVRFAASVGVRCVQDSTSAGEVAFVFCLF
jgi:hypothetical protein